MAKQTFNEAELFLIQNWGEAQVLANTMAKAREESDALMLKAGEAAYRDFPEVLNEFRGFFTQSWTPGELYFGREDWPREGNWPMGLWLSPLSLNSLLSKTSDAPQAWVFVRPARRKATMDVAAAKQKIWSRLAEKRTKEEMKLFSKNEDDDDYLVSWPFSNQEEILRWVTDGEEAKLRECIQDQIVTFVELVPALNDLLRSGKK